MLLCLQCPLHHKICKSTSIRGEPKQRGAARYHFTAFGIIPRVRIIIIHYIGLEILRTDNSSLPARRLIISFFNNR